MAIKGSTMESSPTFTCTHGLTVEGNSEGVFRCCPNTSSGVDEGLVLATRISGVSQDIIGPLSEPSEIQIGTPKLVSQNKSVNKFRGDLSQQEKRIRVQDGLVVHLRKELDTLREGNSQEIQLRKVFEKRVTALGEINREQQEAIFQLEEINYEQRGEIAQLKAVNSLQQKEIARLSADNLSQQDEFEKRINQLKTEISRVEREKTHQLTESTSASDRMAKMERQLVEHKEEMNLLRAEHKEEIDQRLAGLEARLRAEHKEELDRIRAEHKEELDRIRAEHKKELDRIRAEHKKELDQRLAESETGAAMQRKELDQRLAESEKQQNETAQTLRRLIKQLDAKQQEKGNIHFANLLLSSLDGYAPQKPEVSPTCAFAHLVNQKIKERAKKAKQEILKALQEETGEGNQRAKKAQQDLGEAKQEIDKWLNSTVNGVFTKVSYQSSGVYFEAVCEALKEYPFIHHTPPTPNGSIEEKVIRLSQLVVGCSKERNLAAHKKNKRVALSIIGDLLQGYGDDWKPFITTITKE